jgi:NitT/TauT family transport system substrate-binding protein
MVFEMRRVTALAVPLVLALSACGGSAEQADLPGGGGGEGGAEQLTFLMPAPSIIQYHPWHIAEELGYFEEEGVSVEIVAGDGSSSILQQILAGNADVAAPSAGATMLAASTGRELVSVYQYLYSNVFTLAAPEGGEVTTVEDLDGQSVGVSDLAGGEVPLVRVALSEAGLAEGTDATITPVGEGGALTVEALRTGQVQAYASSLFDVALIEAAGYPMVDILPEELQAFPANAITTTPQVMEEKGEAIVGMMRAVTKAILFADTNPEAAQAIGAKYAPEEFEDPKVVEFGWEAVDTLRTMPETLANDPRGSFDEEAYASYAEFLSQGTEEEGALQGEVDLEALLNEEWIEQINDFDEAAVIEQAETYEVQE